MNENCSLLPVASSRSASTNYKARLRSSCTRICIGNKAAVLVLFWNFSVLLVYQCLFNTTSYVQVSQATSIPVILNGVFLVVAVLSPLAGLLTDIKFSRFKTLLCSSYGLLIQVTLGLLAVVVYFASISSSLKKGPVIHPFVIDEGTQFILALTFGVIFGGSVLVTIMLFIINGVQFGMDQLHDSPTEDSILFIHWYVWFYYASVFVSETLWNLIFYDTLIVNSFKTTRIIGTPLAFLTLIALVSILVFSVCILRHKHRKWFHIEPAGFNPYKLVYKVVQFAYQHKVPLRRSAFTFCEDKLPSRMDLGKHKYGGPFTTKEVEDVKAFWGILKVLSCIGPSFMLQMVIQLVPPLYSRHGTQFYEIIFIDNQSEPNKIHLEGTLRHIFISNGLLSPLLVVVCIPLYLCFVRPVIAHRVPGILKRIGLGIILMQLSLLCALAMDIAAHSQLDYVKCMFTSYTNFSLLVGTDYSIVTANTTIIPGLFLNAYFLSSQHFLSALLNTLFDISVLEFVCSQSPYSMKGLLLGLAYTIQHFFQTIAILSILPFGLLAEQLSPFSCGSSYFLMNIIIGFLVMIVFILCVARRYQYRTINEPSNEYRYAEDYYSNIQ